MTNQTDDLGVVILNALGMGDRKDILNIALNVQAGGVYTAELTIHVSGDVKKDMELAIEKYRLYPERIDG